MTTASPWRRTVCHALAMGDGRNDVEMLGWAGLGVAMGDAGPSVKQAADAVTTGVDADGLALELLL